MRCQCELLQVFVALRFNDSTCIGLGGDFKDLLVLNLKIVQFDYMIFCQWSDQLPTGMHLLILNITPTTIKESMERYIAQNLSLVRRFYGGHSRVLGCTYLLY